MAADADRQAIDELCAAYDAEDGTVSLPRGLYEDDRADGHKAPRTIDAWRGRLERAASDIRLTEASVGELNEWTTSLVKDPDGPSATTVRGYESTLKKFYRYHEELGVDPADIDTHDPDGDGWTERDLLTPEERQQLRKAARDPRDRAVYHMLLYTGLRNTALRTLRVDDIDLDNHEFYFNPEIQGAGDKGIASFSEPRPLFQAERAVREWILEYHPTGEPEDYLIRTLDHADEVRPRAMTLETIRATMADLKENAFIDKPCHPHMMRHNFVSMCRKHPEISDADIKFYLGHAPESNVMESTYSHLSSGDHNAAGHTAFGVQDAAEEQADVDPWDTTCGRCDRVLAPAQEVCVACETPRGETPWDVAPTGEPGRIERLEATVEKLSALLDVEPGG